MRSLSAMFGKLIQHASVSRAPHIPRRQFELLESRSMLASDLSIMNFSADGLDLIVNYEIANAAASAFDIAVYRSYDGITLDEFLCAQRIDINLGIGVHQASITANFGDLEQDYQLVALIDSNSEITEDNEQNNQFAFAGGAFLDANNVIQIHGTTENDNLVFAQTEFFQISLNETTFNYSTSVVFGIHLRTHAGDDYLDASYDFNLGIVAFGGEGADYFIGGAGNDTLNSGGGNDSLFGEAGYDSLMGDEGDDFLDGGAGTNDLSGGAGNDTLISTTEESSYSGYGGILDAGEGDDIIYGTPGDDVIDGGAGHDTIYGLGGNDMLFGSDGDDILDGGDGDDYLFGGSGHDALIGQDGNDWLFGGDDADYLCGLAGDDYLDGGQGDDYMLGGAGSDYLYGQTGNDTLYGEDGADYLYGGSGDDYLDGGSGVDTFDTGGDPGDTIGDKPIISNFAHHYNTTNNWVQVTGTIIDDDSCENLPLTFEGVAEGTIPVEADGTFSYIITLTGNVQGWMYFNFTDAEGIAAEYVMLSLT